MSGGPHLPQVAPYPHDLDQFAEVAREELRKGGFGRRPGGKPPRRPTHAGLLVLLAFVFFAVAFFVLAAVCDPGDEQPPVAVLQEAAPSRDAGDILRS